MILSEQEYQSFSQLIHQNFGIHLGDHKQTLPTTRLLPLMNRSGFKSFSDYYKYIVEDSTGQALIALANQISTNYSFFFREKEHMEFLSEVALPQRQAQSRSAFKMNNSSVVYGMPITGFAD